MNVKIAGNINQYLEAEMPPHEILISEAGAMTYYEEGINMEILFLKDGFLGVIKRMFSGEGIILVKFTNNSNSSKKILLSSGTVIHPIKIDTYSDGLICAKSSFFSCTKNINLGIDVDNSISTGLIGGLGFVRQKITGTGTVFLKGKGEIKKIELSGNKIIVDSSGILAFTRNLSFSSKFSNPPKKWMSGEGASDEEISGYGTLWIQCYNDPIKSIPSMNTLSLVIAIIMIVLFICLIFFR